MSFTKEEFDIMEKRCAKNRHRPPPMPESLDNDEGSPLEQKFASLWEAYEGPELEREVKFDDSRKWRFDFLHRESRIAFELEGAIWANGRHNRGSGFVADCSKYLEAALAGYTVIRLVKEQLDEATIRRLIQFVQTRATDLNLLRAWVSGFQP